MTLTNVVISTAGASSAAVATDRGGGTITVRGGSARTSGFRSPAIYSTGTITVTGARMTATGAEAAVVEGRELDHRDRRRLSGAKQHGVMLYNSMSGDAQAGTGSYTMRGGSLTAAEGPAFYVTNTNASITLSAGARVTTSSGVLLRADSAGTGSGNTGAGKATLVLSGERLTGNLSTGGTGTITAILRNGTVLHSTIDTAALTLDAGSVWSVTGNSTLSNPRGHGGDLGEHDHEHHRQRPHRHLRRVAERQPGAGREDVHAARRRRAQARVKNQRARGPRELREMRQPGGPVRRSRIAASGSPGCATAGRSHRNRTLERVTLTRTRGERGPASLASLKPEHDLESKDPGHARCCCLADAPEALDVSLARERLSDERLAVHDPSRVLGKAVHRLACEEVEVRSIEQTLITLRKASRQELHSSRVVCDVRQRDDDELRVTHLLEGVHRSSQMLQDVGEDGDVEALSTDGFGVEINLLSLETALLRQLHGASAGIQTDDVTSSHVPE